MFQFFHTNLFGGAAMKSRTLCLGSILLISLAGCSKKPDDAANSANQNQSNQGSNTSGSNTAGADSNATGYNSSGSGPAGSNTSNPNGGSADNSAASSSAPAPAPQPIVVPKGTTLLVRLGEDVGSKVSTPGQAFRATLSRDLTVDGNPVIPRGATVRGTVVDAKPLGRFKGGALLVLRLTSVSVNGTERRIQTASLTTELKGKGKRTAVMTGGGGAFGAIVGGIAGGGKGAAIGAAAGAGAGAGGSALTGNKEILFPAESALSFRLSSSFRVTE
jgi:hypothetical protein